MVFWLLLTLYVGGPLAVGGALLDLVEDPFGGGMMGIPRFPSYPKRGVLRSLEAIFASSQLC